MNLSKKQKSTISSAIAFVKLHDAAKRIDSTRRDVKLSTPTLVITGYAGTGKSVIISELYRSLTAMGMIGTVVALTGRACENINMRGVPAATCHSRMYEPVMDAHGNLKYFRPLTPQQLEDSLNDYVIIEEASMVPSEILDALLQSRKPIVFVGDDAQLPPINGYNVFDAIADPSSPMNNKLADTPVIVLDEIFRTQSGNPINVFADKIRSTGVLDLNMVDNKHIFTESRVRMNVNWFKSNPDWNVVICGTNKDRKRYNRVIRAAKGFHGELPMVGERVICLENNIIGGININNGEFYEVIWVSEGDTTSTFGVSKVDPMGNKISNSLITIVVENNYWDSEESEDGRNRAIQKFTYGYAVTCHKMQGSQADNVIVDDTDVSFFLDRARYRYTAVTRASSKVLIAK